MADAILDPEDSQGSEFLNAVGGADALDNYEHDEELHRAYQNTLYFPHDHTRPPLTINPRDLILQPPQEVPSGEKDDGLSEYTDPEEDDEPMYCEMEQPPMCREEDAVSSDTFARQTSPWVPGSPESNLADNNMGIDSPEQQPSDQQSSHADSSASVSPVSPVVGQSETTLVAASNVQQHVNDPSRPLAVAVEEAGLYPCEYPGCTRRFDSTQQRKNHMKRCPVGKEPKHQCEECSKLYWYPKDVVRCKLKHAGATVGCQNCGKTYTRADNMKRHRCNAGSAARASAGPSSRSARAAHTRSRRLSSAGRSNAVAATHTRPELPRMSALNPAPTNPAVTATPPAQQASAGVYPNSHESSIVTPSTDARRQSSAFSRQQWSTPITEPDQYEIWLDPRLHPKNQTPGGQSNAFSPSQ